MLCVAAVRMGQNGPSCLTIHGRCLLLPVLPQVSNNSWALLAAASFAINSDKDQVANGDVVGRRSRRATSTS